MHVLWGEWREIGRERAPAPRCSAFNPEGGRGPALRRDGRHARHTGKKAVGGVIWVPG